MTCRKLPTDVWCQKLSNWEVEEAYWAWRRGEQIKVLAARYGISAKGLKRAFVRMETRGEEVPA